MQEADIDRVAKIWLDTNRTAHHFIPAEYWEGHFEAVKEMFAQAEIYVYEETEEEGTHVPDAGQPILGFIGLAEDYIAGIFVLEKAQSGGIGKQLLDFVKGRKKQLSLNVYQRNTRAIRFYQREQFEVQREGTEEATGEKEYLMVWRPGTDRKEKRMQEGQTREGSLEPWRIRKAAETDCRRVYELICALEGRELSFDRFFAIYQKQLKDRHYYCFVCEAEHQVIGVLNLRIEEQLHHAEWIAEILEFAIDAAYRSRGIGREMLAHAFRAAKESGCVQIELACNQLRLDAHRFYEREGMHNSHFKFSGTLTGDASADPVIGK